MKITKLGHCCLLIEYKDKRVLTDPGTFTNTQDDLKNLDIILITHEHADHFHIDSLKTVLQNNPNSIIITNKSVGDKLSEEGINFILLEGNDSKTLDELNIIAVDGKHEEIFEEIGQVQNTGYLLDSKLFYPGDSFCDPKTDIEVLALPVAGPWCRLRDAIKYCLKVKPKKAFPVHDGMIQKDKIGLAHRIPEMTLKQNGIDFVPMIENSSVDF